MRKTISALLAICSYRQLDDLETIEYLTNVLGRDYTIEELERARAT
jgi:hypothetical protein